MENANSDDEYDADDYQDGDRHKSRLSFSSCQSRTAEDGFTDGRGGADDTDADTPTPQNFDDDTFADLNEGPTPTSPPILSPNINIPERCKETTSSGFYSNSLPSFDAKNRLFSTEINIDESEAVRNNLLKGNEAVIGSQNAGVGDYDEEGEDIAGYIIDDSNEYFGVLTDGASSNINVTPATNAHGSSGIRIAYDSRKDATVESAKDGKTISAASDASEDNSCTMAEVCFESVLWLSQRLGPVLTAKHLTRNLLRMLTLCYLPLNGALQPIPWDPKGQLSVTQKRIQGDLSSTKVLECLSEIACLYGEQVIMVQYISHICDLISSCNRKLTPTSEAGVIGSMALLRHILLYLSDSTFMGCLQETLIKGALYPVIRLLASTRTSFPSRAPVRATLAYRVVDIIFVMGLR